MRLETPYVRPIRFRDESGYEKAKKHYLTVPAIKFEDDIIWYFKNGWLHASPTCFALGCVINIAPENTNLVQPAWFIRYAIGDLYEILRLLPCYFEYIVWCRDNEDEGRKLRRWKTERLLRIAMARKRSGFHNVPNVANAGSTPVRAEAQEGVM